MSLKLEFFKRFTNISAKVIADSISLEGKRITTLEIEYPRYILAELNTHKALEKNSSSSRAIPIKAMIEQIQSNMAVPLYWGKTKAGMQADGEIESIQTGKKFWNEAFVKARNSAFGLSEIGLHKQTANRLLEPFQMMKTVITGTDWDNFFNLRIHPDAQPEFCMLAYKMYMAIQESTPMVLKAGEWHLPYITTMRGMNEDESWDMESGLIYCTGNLLEGNLSKPLTIEEAQRISASCTAQTSYRKSDDSLEKADKVFDLLIKADVLHASPFGHLATPAPELNKTLDSDRIFCEPNTMMPSSWDYGITHLNRDGVFCSGNLQGWISYRHLIPNNTCYDFDFEKRMELFK